ncbi:MAG: hypothetical protein NTX45_26295 [Proteobacteria bacterium]|nr:hypothetical protein [Pseudomonadota bacterium]
MNNLLLCVSCTQQRFAPLVGKATTYETLLPEPARSGVDAYAG